MDHDYVWENDENMRERFRSATDRIMEIPGEAFLSNEHQLFFNAVADRLGVLRELAVPSLWDGGRRRSEPDCGRLKESNRLWYQEQVDGYDRSYANPSFAVEVFGNRTGNILSFLYCETQAATLCRFRKR